jgi:hypothetical protein
MGNTAFLPPIWVREVVRLLKEKRALPFLTDTNTLYAGQRTNAVLHILNAAENGFTLECCGAPIIIADGLRGENVVKIPIEGRHFKEIMVAAAAIWADAIVCLTHFKCHVLTGFGGAIKNIGMGFAAKEGKSAMHMMDEAPYVKEESCSGCGRCKKRCPTGAITVEECAKIDARLCKGCAQCIVSCPQKAIKIDWEAQAKEVPQRIAEYAYGILKGKKSCFLNFCMNITPDCDCCPHSDAPVCEDIGILASFDPVAIDQASADLVNKVAGKDVFAQIHPKVNWKEQLEHSEKLGVGKREYELVHLE